MLYAALTFWLFVIVFSAWAVHSLWSALVKPRVVNALLLPGTLVAQLGHVLGLLVTGHSVTNTSLMGDDEKGAPQADAPESPKVPILGSILIGLLPLVACAAALYFVTRQWGAGVLGSLAGGSLSVPQELPKSLTGFWELLRSLLSAAETVVNALIQAAWPQWTTALFVYLSVCLTVRMTPFEGNRRGALGAIALAGLTVGVAASVTTQVEEFVLSSWPILSFAVAMLIVLLLVSLLISGGVGLIRILAKNQ